MKHLKRVLAAWLILIIFCSSGILVYAGETPVEPDGRTVSVWEAEAVAVNHIVSVMRTEDAPAWNNGVKIQIRKALFDENQTLSAYYFGLVDRSGNPQGYVITGAVTTDYPIIEYAKEGASFLDNAVEITKAEAERSKDKTVRKDGSKIYYLGEMTYVVEHTYTDCSQALYDITTGQYATVEKKHLKTQNTEATAEYQQLWDYYKELADRNDRSGNPPDSVGGDFITNPNNYESGYDDSRYFTVTNGYRKYNVMDDFFSGEVCYPTVATNLCLYWYLRDPSSYGNLYKNCSWDDVFWRFYDYMGTDLKEGTLDDKVAGAYEAYFNEVGLSCSAYFYRGTNNGRNVVNELNNDRPCHLMVHDHYKYKQHGVLAVGYSEFTYFGWYQNSYSTYIRIADGWTDYPTRYVWGACNGYWNYVVVIPG